MKAGATDSVAQLLEFLRDRDVSCPRCGYNLRNLPRPQCPECLEDLALTVGFERPPIGWLIVTITPCTFSGIAAALLLIPIIVGPLMGGGRLLPMTACIEAMERALAALARQEAVQPLRIAMRVPGGSEPSDRGTP